METDTTEYGPKDIAKMLAPMRLGALPKITFHSELAASVRETMGVEKFDADFVIGFLGEQKYIWHFDVERAEYGAYILTEKGMNLLRRHL